MKKVLFLITLVSVISMTACTLAVSGNGSVSETSSIIDDSNSNAVNNESDVYSASESSQSEASKSEEQTLIEDAAKATAYYCFYGDTTEDQYVPTARDEEAYWRTLRLYCAVLESEKSDKVTTDDHGNLSIDSKNAEEALHVLFADFDGNLLKETPSDISGSSFENGKYYFGGGDFGDDNFRVINNVDLSRDKKDEYDVVVEHYNGGDRPERIYGTSTVHVKRNEKQNSASEKANVWSISSVTIKKTDSESDAKSNANSDSDSSSVPLTPFSDTKDNTLSITMGKRQVNKYYKNNDPSQQLLLTEEYLLPTITGGDESVNAARNEMKGLENENKKYTKDALNGNAGTLPSENEPGWLESLLSDVIYDDGRYVSLEVAEQRNEGGAHGRQTFYYYVFDKQEGKRLQLSDVIKNDEASFESIFTKYFKEDLDGRETDLSAEDITAEKHLNDYRFYLTDEDLVIMFNRGEIGATALGQVYISIPYSELDMNISVKELGYDL